VRSFFFCCWSQVQVHQRLYMLRAGNLEGDPIPELAADMLAAHGGLLCFDEFQVTDVADAMLMNRLFTELWRQGAVVVATSNRPPVGLYEGGLQRESCFLPFVAELEARCAVLEMAAGVDYRRHGKQGTPAYFTVPPPWPAAAAVSAGERGDILDGPPPEAEGEGGGGQLEQLWEQELSAVGQSECGGGGGGAATTLRTSTRRCDPDPLSPPPPAAVRSGVSPCGGGVAGLGWVH
jgi:hypothetical protein